ncbi:(1-_4)-alpha-D-glucan 1-alpha-D-glucosylmutase [Bosea sp. OAE752]|uniref:malto-oligosyltrehalose synthase n=1 Tax=Bosea sp. OAE752 TaxID=2663873 RepID=UPI003D217A5A
MKSHDALVRKLADLVGIGAFYADAAGVRVEISFEARRAVLRGLGIEVDTEAHAREALALIEQRRASPVSPFCFARAGQIARVPLSGSQDMDVLDYVLTDETGATREGRGRIQSDRSGRLLVLPALAAGYWQLRLAPKGIECESLLISSPRRCFEPASVARGTRRWGVTAQVYSLRSQGNFGIGDYGDLADLAEGAAELGADFLGLNPVHSLFCADLTKNSPYSPSSRRFLDAQLIDPRRLAGFTESGAQAMFEDAEMQASLAALRDTALVDRAASWRAKLPILQAVWQASRRDGDRGFEDFSSAAGQPLVMHAVFEALSEHFSAEGARSVGEWPDAFRRADGQAVKQFITSHRDRIDFHAWLQWQADRQLGEAHQTARNADMGIGLFRDLAVGVDRDGSDVWSTSEHFATGLSIGAPPDLLGPEGQNWGLPPFDPFVMEKTGLAAFRGMVSANMRHAGAVRIDHAFQLQRLYLIPEGARAVDGAYVSMPFEALLAVLKLESHRARCMVVAEDLGTSPEGFSDAIMASGLYSYRVLTFEREANGYFKAPEAYPERALAVLSTHDLPTFRGWWRGLDLDMRHAAGRASASEAERMHEERALDRARLTEALVSQSLLPAGDPPVDPPVEAAAVYLGRACSALTGIQLEDAVGELNQANLPGPSTWHPNWQRKLSHDVREVVAPGGSLARLGALLADEGRSSRQHGAMALAAPPPRATYRLQFHASFTFDDAIPILPYLEKLGISHIYASPLQKAWPGSTHGYDIIDHAEINPELGGMDGFLRFSDALKSHGLGLLLDIVPNHMGVGGADNAWWQSVIEWGRLSPDAIAFDIDWERLGANGKLVLPFLGRRYSEALEAGELKLTFDGEEGGFCIHHFEHRFPVNPLTYPVVLDRILMLVDASEPSFREVLTVSVRLRALSELVTAMPGVALIAECEALKRRLSAAFATSDAFGKAAVRAVELINGTRDIPESFDTLHRLLEMQSYRLAYWRVAASEINYRRFFDINTLAGIRIEEPSVFDRTHGLIFDLVKTGRVQGLRIDHVDGLADPEGYLRALQARVGPGFYILVEKILGHGETLRGWPISGTTGYDALNLIDGVLLDRSAAKAIEEAYAQAAGRQETYEDALRRAKREVLESSFASELEVVVSDLARIAAADRRTRDYTVNAMRRALTEIVVEFPVYRSYVSEEAAPEDRALVEKVVAASIARSALPDNTIHTFIAETLLGDRQVEAESLLAAHIGRFRRRFQQLTGPVAAKSIEDTLFYRRCPLLALNEVGGEPSAFGVSLDAFHASNIERSRSWPHAMVATATHDTKRGEDARARLLALSEMPSEWANAAQDWQRLSREIAASDIPDANDRHLILQQILAGWPMSLLDCDRTDELEAFRQRMQGWAEKALREAKSHTSWVNPQEGYEAATKDLIARALVPGSAFFEHFRPLAQQLARRGALKSLARTVLKLTLPGVPDFYQGTELWDLSLVDPDNRHPVDYDAAHRMINDRTDLPDLMATWQDGRVKQRLIEALLADRRAAPRLYADGDYRPLAVEGPLGQAALAFERRLRSERLLVVVARHGGNGADGARNTLGSRNALWLANLEGTWRDILAGGERTFDRERALDDILGELPVMVLRGTGPAGLVS